MIILGIHDGHNCGATLLKNGKILSSVSEERIVRIKNVIGYPKRSIEEVLQIANLTNLDLDEVVYASNFMHTKEHLERKNEWYKAGYIEQDLENKKNKEYLKAVFDLRKKKRIETVFKHLKIKKDKIFFVEHHLAHAAAAYFGSSFSHNKKTLILTCDGAGDGISSTVSVGYKNKIKRMASSPRSSSLGKIYSRITYHLGLQPWEHDYKVMGLAPYGKKEIADKMVDIFNKVSIVKKNSLQFTNPTKLNASFLFDYLKEKLLLARFDNIALAVQTYLERQLLQWIKNCIKKIKINQIVVGGGVFMNVKANQKILSLKKLKRYFVFPSCGDESLSFGAVWHRYFLKKTNNQKLLPNLYLGRSYSNSEVKNIIFKKFKNKKKYKITKSNDIEGATALLLVKNEIVARFSGRAEWGARSLGNRSILANPNSWENIEKINNLIKKRDFWMPFAPSISYEKRNKYFNILKNTDCPFMTFSFDSKVAEQNKIPAALHPRDKTGRIQIVKKEDNFKYWDLIKKFGKITGIECVLNTSFNLHGYPVVYSPTDAIDVFCKSGLKYLAIEDFLVEKCK